MFGLNDSNNNPQNGQNNPEPSIVPAGQIHPAPVHGPLSNMSPGGAPNLPSSAAGPAVSPTFSDINLPQPPPPAQSGSSNDSKELLDIKHQALENLEPLISHLDQSPEEKFRTTMMLIQASDNPKLLSQAHEAANQIKDEKQRAQALLDVVNEINYFTHQAK